MKEHTKVIKWFRFENKFQIHFQANFISPWYKRCDIVSTQSNVALC